MWIATVEIRRGDQVGEYSAVFKRRAVAYAWGPLVRTFLRVQMPRDVKFKTMVTPLVIEQDLRGE